MATYRDLATGREYPFSRSTYYKRRRLAREKGITMEALARRIPVDGRGRHGRHARASDHAAWAAGGRFITDRGYVRIRVGTTHPLANRAGYALEHLVVWYSAGRKVAKDCCLHHKNLDRTDNRLANLEVMSRAAHSSLHADIRRRGKKGRP